MNQRIEQLFEVPEERLWEVFLFDEAYNEGLYRHLKLRVEERRLEREGSWPRLVVKRGIAMVPDRQLPAVLKAIVRGATLVREEGSFSSAARRFDLVVSVPVFGSNVDYGGSFTWEPIDDGRGTRRIWEGYCRARIPLVGSAIERYLLGEMERGLAQAYAYSTTYFAGRAE